MTQTSSQGSRQPKSDEESFEAYAWRVHQALHDWTAKVDAKASVILTLETAVLGLIVAFVQTEDRLSHLSGPNIWVFRSGVVLLVCAIILAGSAIFPQLNRRDAKRNWNRNYVYFGHLRRWAPSDLVNTLKDGNDQRNELVLSTQLIALSQIVWRKHAFLQYSMCMVVPGNITIWASLLLA
ncbi:hypothetical protein ETD83_36815 [Actinomadura soli]|uniref:Pycsar effector protein domain-containing protein n=1 Tax=Actinomadura soli TaxID=2508997 RepID=A0A5C4J0F9_9ACTN|nr:Pycsar system effector family protein [Actinomadura soli]TMQ90113.1 hypothetical protein ETD83_36815 [Actinomadura soli]